MALVTCPDCEKKVSDAATACAGCGRPLRAASQAPRQKPHWTQDRNLGCLGACLIFLVLPAILIFRSCGP